MIIALAGRKQHGKDTVAKIIQYLIAESNGADLVPFEECLRIWDQEEKTNPNCGTDWQRKMFAEKLKQIVCLLIGCTMEQLEDNEFKEKPLGEEWRVYRMWALQKWNLIDEETYKKMEGINGFETEVLTPRKMLQLIGTECGRNIIHPNIWYNALMREYKPSWTKETKQYWKDKIAEYPNWIITDCRFPNEIPERDDVIPVKVFRPGMPDTDIHESETALDNYPFKYVIHNGGTIEDLVNEVKLFLKSVNLIT